LIYYILPVHFFLIDDFNIGVIVIYMITAGEFIEILKKVPPNTVLKIMEDGGQWEQHYWRTVLKEEHIKYNERENELLIGD